MEVLISAAALSERINKLLLTANREDDAIPLRGGTLANLAQLVHALTRTETSPSINTIIDNLREISSDLIALLSHERRKRIFYDNEWTQNVGILREAFFRRYLSHVSQIRNFGHFNQIWWLLILDQS